MHHGGGSDFGSFLPISCKGIEQCQLFLLYQSMIFSVTDYGLGLTAMAKTNLLKLDAVQNKEMRTMLSLNKQGMHVTISKSVYLPQKYASHVFPLLLPSLFLPPLDLGCNTTRRKKGFNN